MDYDREQPASFKLNSLLYYDTRSTSQIATPLTLSRRRDVPVQLISPNGKSAIGIPLLEADRSQRNVGNTQDDYLVRESF